MMCQLFIDFNMYLAKDVDNEKGYACEEAESMWGGGALYLPLNLL